MRAVNSPAITSNSFQSDAVVLEYIYACWLYMRLSISGDIISYSRP